MTEYHNLKCPNCGSIPKYDKEKKVFICNYCGAELARDYKLIPKNEKKEDLIKDAIIDFEGRDFEYSYRKFAAALNLDPDNVVLKFNKEATRVLKGYHHPDVELDWEMAFDILKEVYKSNIKQSEKSDCFETFLTMAIETFEYNFAHSFSYEYSAECINYASKYLKKLYNELELSKKDKKQCLETLKDLIKQSVDYFSKTTDDPFDLEKAIEQFKEVQKELEELK